MRAFIALEIPPLHCARIARVIADVSPHLPPARWVKESGYHLTLLFLGEIDVGLVSPLEARLAPVFRAHRRLSVQLAVGGTFPKRRPARVAWIGLERPARIIELASAVDAALTGLVERRERRVLQTHLTVARCRRPWSRAAVERWVTASRGPIGKPFFVTRGVLMRSRLGAGGARYDVVAAFPLGDTG